jgi:hypothetical protein
MYIHTSRVNLYGVESNANNYIHGAHCVTGIKFTSIGVFLEKEETHFSSVPRVGLTELAHILPSANGIKSHASNQKVGPEAEVKIAIAALVIEIKFKWQRVIR